MFRTISLCLAVVAALAACSPQTTDGGALAPAMANAPATHPQSGLAVIPVTITTARGPHVIRAEVAASPEEQQRGLMFRTAMGADEGMLFPYEDDPHQLSFWMRNTVLPLDLIFIGPDRRVLNVAANAVPYSEAQILSDGVGAAVLEINGGRAAQLGISPGDQVDW